MRAQVFEKSGKPLSANIMSDIISTLEAQAQFAGPECEVYLRTGSANEVAYVDLGTPDAAVVKIDAGGWMVSQCADIRFYRSAGLLPLPVPVRGNGLQKFKNLLRLDDASWHLLVAFAISSLAPKGPFMCLLVQGEHGSGKSLLCSFLKRLIDPNLLEKSRLPREERNLMIQAQENRLLVFDNASRISEDISDALCSLATGSGLGTRRLYTDAEQQIFSFCRPFIANGISGYADRPDLLERAIVLKLPEMPVKRRATEEGLKEKFEKIRPEILGALYDAVACGLARLRKTPTPVGMRMADAGRWIAAAEPALGVKPGSLIEAILTAQNEAMAETVADSPLLNGLLRLTTSGPFYGTVGDLFNQFDIDLGQPGFRDFPPNPSRLATTLTLKKALLERAGVRIQFGGRSNLGRSIRVWRTGQDPTKPVKTPSGQGLDPRV
jgi:hypothetical protein